MKNNLINNMVLKSNIVFLILNIILTVFTVKITYPYYTNIYNFFLGPFNFDTESLISINKLKEKSDYETRSKLYTIYMDHPLEANYYVNNNKYFFKVSGDKSYHSGVQDIEEGMVIISGIKSERQSMAISDYLLLEVEDRVLVVRAPVKSSGTKFSGIILPLFSGIKHEIRVSTDDRELDVKLLPFMLDATGNFKKDVYYQIALSALLFAFILFNYFKILIRFINPLKHPLYKKIGIYGPEKKVAEDIMKEINDHVNSYEDGCSIITPNWIIKKSLFRPQISKNYIKKEKY